MRRHDRLAGLIELAEQEQRCIYVDEPADLYAIRRRVREGSLVNPFRGMYAEAEYWRKLNLTEQAMHVIRTLAKRKPQRVFAGLSAATVYDLEHSWSLHSDGMVTIATRNTTGGHTYGKLRRIYVRESDWADVRDQDGVRVTSPARTLVDCGRQLAFVDALAIFDSALRKQLVTKEEVEMICNALRQDCAPVRKLLEYADPASENGGESYCRAVIIELGFEPPQLQVEFRDPDAPANVIRVDFLWRTPDGGMVVLEFDGMRKYVDPSMTNGRDVQRVVLDERRREESLRKVGVTVILRTDYREVRQGSGLFAKLSRAGVPLATV